MDSKDALSCSCCCYLLVYIWSWKVLIPRFQSAERHWHRYLNNRVRIYIIIRFRYNRWFCLSKLIKCYKRGCEQASLFKFCVLTPNKYTESIGLTTTGEIVSCTHCQFYLWFFPRFSFLLVSFRQNIIPWKHHYATWNFCHSFMQL